MLTCCQSAHWYVCFNYAVPITCYLFTKNKITNLEKKNFPSSGVSLFSSSRVTRAYMTPTALRILRATS